MKNKINNNRILFIGLRLLLCSVYNVVMLSNGMIIKWQDGETVLRRKFSTIIVYPGKNIVRLYGFLCTQILKLQSVKFFLE